MTFNRKLVSFYSVLLASLLFHACAEQKAAQEEDRVVPSASGKLETVVVLLDTAQRDLSLGQVIDSILHFSLPGLYFEEEVLNIHHVHPESFGTVWQRQRHLFIPLTLEDNGIGNSKIRAQFTDELLQNKDKDYFTFIKKDVFAEGQDCYVAVAKNVETLTDSLLSDLESIRYFYDQSVLQGLKNNLQRNSKKDIEEILTLVYGVEFIVPEHFEIAHKEPTFFWLRKAHEDYDLNFYLTYRDYVSEAQFDDNALLEWRASIGEKYLKGTNSHMQTQLSPPPVFEEQNINGNYTKVGRGLWEMTGDNYMGGYFVSYTFVHEPLNRIYYFESFLYYPRQNSSKKYWAEKMRKYREGEAILNSFKIK